MVDFPCAVKAGGRIGNQNVIWRHLNARQGFRFYWLDVGTARLLNTLQAALL